jgi:putative glycosyltransferase (TIGR04372 family)
MALDSVDQDLFDIRTLIDGGSVERGLRRLRGRLLSDIGNLPALALLIETLVATAVALKPKWAGHMNAVLREIRTCGSIGDKTAARVGYFLLHRREVALARAMGDWTLARFPESREAALFRATLFQRIGEQAQSLRLLRELAARLPDDVEIGVHLAQRLFATGADQEAAAAADRLAAHQERLDVRLLLLRARCRLGPAGAVPELAGAALEAGASDRDLAPFVGELAAAGQDAAARELLGLLWRRFPQSPRLARLRLEFDPAAAADPGVAAVAGGGDADLLTLLADAQIGRGMLQEADATVRRLEAAAPEGVAVEMIRARLLQAQGAAAEADALEAAAIAEAVGAGSVKIDRQGPVRILGVIGAHGLGDFVYQLLALASVKRQFRNGWLTLIYSHDLSYKDDVIRFCPDLNEVLDYAGGALEIPVATKDWEEFRQHLILPQPALSPTLLARFARTAAFAVPAGEQAPLQAELASRGLDPGRWFVVLHYRQSSTFAPGVASPRDVDGSTFHELARAICAAGGQVARLGHGGMDPMPEVPGYVDLSGTSVALQLYATSRARFMVGCDSGPSSYATAFKTPLFKTNTFSEDGAFSSRDLLLPKNVVTWRGEVLSLGDVLSQRLVFFKKLPAQGGFRFMDNTLAQLQHGADIMFRRTADCLGWRDGPPPDETPCPDALAWPYWPGRVAQCLDLAHLAGLPVRKVTL